MRKRSHYGALAVFALAGATAAALFLSAPVSSPPTFLERAEAALAPPGDTVLHYKWMETSSVTNPACSVTRGPNEIWIDLAPPHRYRAILDDPPAGAHPDKLACTSGTVREVGGTVDPACSPKEQANCTTMDTLEFEPPNMLRVSPLQFVLPPDPVTMLREAISAGHARREGKAQLNGRIVERIDIDPVLFDGLDEVMASACAFPSCAFRAGLRRSRDLPSRRDARTADGLCAAAGGRRRDRAQRDHRATCPVRGASRADRRRRRALPDVRVPALN